MTAPATVNKWYVERHDNPALRRSFEREDLAQEYARVIDRIHGAEVTRIFMAPVIEMIEPTKPVGNPPDRTTGHHRRSRP